MEYQSFKLESLNLDMKEQKLTINGKEVSLNGITDFGLFHDGVAWKFNCKRDVTCEVAETHIKEPSIQHQGILEEKQKGGAEVGKNRISLVNTLRAAFKVILILEDEKIPYGMFEEVMESVKSIIAVTPIKHNPSDENHFSFPK